ncbi:MAG: hypothetical protein D4R67_05925 [Bacteroidetes bacterium]|nr:MAG: hypothetical protein D4R67_05925 [Bacteroidota bacterium]
MEDTFSEKESLDLIRQMIDTAKNNLQQGTGKVFLLWGYLVAGISLATTILLITLPGDNRYYAYYLWFLMAFGAPFHYLLIRKMERERLVMTYIDKMMRWVWIAFTVSILTVVIGLVLSSLLIYPALSAAKATDDFARLFQWIFMPGSAGAYQPVDQFHFWFQWLFIPPFMLCLYGIALFITGKAYGFRPLYLGGIICWGSVLLLLVTIHHPYVLEIQQIFLCFCAITGYVIPGHLLRKKEGSDVARA